MIKGVDTEAVTKLTIAGYEWDLCGEHGQRFAEPLLAALGEPLSVASGQEQPAVEREPERPLGGWAQLDMDDREAADFCDYCTRIRDRRTGLEGDRVLDPYTQAAYAQYRRDVKKFEGICQAEREHLKDWAENRDLDPEATATHVEFRGWLRAEFPDKADEYGGRHKDAQLMLNLTADRNRAMSESSERWGKERERKQRDEWLRRAMRSLPKPKTESELIREWAAENGFEVNKRGPIPAKVREAYQVAKRDETQERKAESK
ncbi:hypothetical protein GZL_01416 [Streptomyces sp. 769]|nr:hypothetical protein GZL_01416 [Streptomyces sp. 769]